MRGGTDFRQGACHVATGSDEEAQHVATGSDEEAQHVATGSDEEGGAKVMRRVAHQSRILSSHRNQVFLCSSGWMAVGRYAHEGG